MIHSKLCMLHLLLRREDYFHLWIPSPSLLFSQSTIDLSWPFFQLFLSQKGHEKWHSSTIITLPLPSRLPEVFFFCFCEGAFHHVILVIWLNRLAFDESTYKYCAWFNDDQCERCCNLENKVVRRVYWDTRLMSFENKGVDDTSILIVDVRGIDDDRLNPCLKSRWDSTLKYRPW